MEIAELKEKWTGFEFDIAEFEVSERDILDFAQACGEVEPRFTDPSHDDFQAPTNFPTRFSGRRVLPQNFPKIGSGRGFDAGKGVTAHTPIRPGDRLVGKSRIHDVFEKTGRSGRMIFIVHRMEFTNQRDELVAVVDWRMVQQPDA